MKTPRFEKTWGLVLYSIPIQGWSHGDDPCWVDGFVAAIVVALDVVKVDGLGHARQLINPLGVGPEVGVGGQGLEVALEMPKIDSGNAAQVGTEADICLGQAIAHQVVLTCKPLFHLV